jgi:hypothetical protein
MENRRRLREAASSPGGASWLLCVASLVKYVVTSELLVAKLSFFFLSQTVNIGSANQLNS